MKFLKYSLITLATLVLVGSAGYLYAGSGLQTKPGYADLTLPGWFEADTTLAVKLGPSGMKPVRWLLTRAIESKHRKSEVDEQAILNLLQQLEGAHLRIYDVHSNREVFEQAIDESVATLRAQDWQLLIRVREDKERVVVLQSEQGGIIQGVSILASNEENAVFVNLVGQISPESIAEIAESLNRS